MQTDLIIYAVIAAGLVFWLRSILGTRHGDERQRPNPFAQTGDLPVSDAPVAGLPLPQSANGSLALPRNVNRPSESVERELSRLKDMDPAFDAGRFCSGAQDAFAIIVEAFAAKDRDTLKNLLEPPVYQSFDAAITEREKSGESVSTEIHAVRSMEILAAKIDGGKAFIKMRFLADETSVVRNADGAIVSGDPDRTTQMDDVWTFSRVLRSRDPKWLLAETSEGPHENSDATPIPSTH